MSSNNWLSKIYDDIQGLLVNRHIFQEVQQIIRSNPRIHLASSFYDWLRNVYLTTAVIGVRRQLDRDKRSISLTRLFEEIIENPEILSRERYVAIYEGSGLPDQYADVVRITELLAYSAAVPMSCK